MQSSSQSTNPFVSFFSLMFWPIASFFNWLLNSIAYTIFFAFISKVKNYGQITIKLPEEEKIRTFGRLDSKHIVHIEVKNTKNFLWRCVTQGDIGFAEAYIAGDFDCTDLTMFFKILLANRSEMNGLDSSSAWLGHVLDRLSHLRAANTIENTRRNIEKHYDLGNEMFQIFLDQTMTYSCAYFKSIEPKREQPIGSSAFLYSALKSPSSSKLILEENVNSSKNQKSSSTQPTSKPPHSYATSLSSSSSSLSSSAFSKDDKMAKEHFDHLETLEEAQMNKIRKLIERANIQKGDKVLEIGSGWGACAIEVALSTGCHITTVTLSSQQKLLVEEKVKKLGLESQITVVLKDYRDLEGKFNKIISCEMLEAVGHEFLPVYFNKISSLLVDDKSSRFVFQVITSPQKNYENYKNSCDFIQKHIFPGGLCPSVNAILDAVETVGDLVVEESENIGFHYARTLKEWREKFLLNKHEILTLGFDEYFIRKWEYYFCYCEAGFETRYLGDYHFVLTKNDFGRIF